MFTPLNIKHWRTILAWVTAFTIGHSLTLALCAFNVVFFSPALIEIAIALTIFWGASRSIYYVFYKKDLADAKQNFGTIMFFGLIHGMGFSNQLKQISVSPNNLLYELLGFNIGLELGQLLFLAVLFGLKFATPHVYWENQQQMNKYKYQFELSILIVSWICGLWMSIDRIVNS